MTAPGAPAGPPPAGFRELRVRTRLADGSYERAVEELFGWGMHRAVPLVRVAGGTPRAAPGVRVVVRLGPVSAPCRVVWVLREADAAGFGYGTLPGHPERGEESFVVRRLPGGAVDFTVRAVSHPAAWYARAVPPLTRLAQWAAARQYGRALRKLSRPR